MRKITQQSVSAFIAGVNFKSGNMQIVLDVEKTEMYLHNNLIAVHDRMTDEIKISNAGWQSVTTKERLNGLIENVTGYADKIYQKNFVWYWKDDKKFPCNEFVILKGGE